MKPPIDEATRRRRHRNERIAAAIFVLLAGAGVWLFIRWDAREQAEFERNRLYIPKAEKITPEILLLQEYVRIPTITGNERPGAEWLVAQFAKNGVRAELVESVPGRFNVYARIRGKQQGEGLLLLNHIDVVPASEQGWDHPPFSGAIQQNMLYGRGVLDMKGLAVTQLLAFVAVARSGRVPEHDLVFLAVCDEEEGGEEGIVALLEKRPDIFAGIRYSLNEGGLSEVIAERMTYFGIEIGGKQASRVIVSADSLEPLRQARFALQRQTTRREPQRILPEVRALFRKVAPTRARYRKQLSDIDASVRNGTFWELPHSYRELTHDVTLMRWPYEKDGRYQAVVDLFDLPGTSADARIRQLAAELAPFGVRIERVVTRGATAPLSRTDTPLFRRIITLIETTYDTTAGTLILASATNDSRYLRQRGITSYGILPFPVDAFQSASIHRANERVRLDWFVLGVGVMRQLVTGYVFDQPVTESVRTP
ncbi:MAG TPA: M20/M25/M40 family metallo-hydrolase [Thermoanaerobaculia bacterium]|jgi:acetylornithine deacetylase/succinyl-diaminopimelate desuccinylase-like protein